MYLKNSLYGQNSSDNSINNVGLSNRMHRAPIGYYVTTWSSHTKRQLGWRHPAATRGISRSGGYKKKNFLMVQNGQRRVGYELDQ
jgi:hypothetical protein